MNSPPAKLLLLLVTVVLTPVFAATVFADEPTASIEAPSSRDERFFRERIEPVLKRACYECHSGETDSPEGELRLDSSAGVRTGGENGSALNLKKVNESLLLRALRHEGGLEMPPDKPKLNRQVIEDFEKWISAGAVDPRVGPIADGGKARDARRHWAFQGVKRCSPPRVDARDWVRNPVDAFVLAKLEKRGWQGAPPAERIDLIRRVYFDLIGLPPSPEEIADFLNDDSLLAYERVVDTLLSSRHFGERWAQHWLDVVRYAETEGYEYDRHIPDAWRFRDYVIDAFNADKPFDRFVTEQLAGDELASDDNVDVELLSATIFHRLGAVRRNAGNPDIALSRNEVLTERTDIIGSAFLGLSVGCARCHNHKLEPISQKDYYSLQAYLASTQEENVVLAPRAEQQAWEARGEKLRQQIKDLESQKEKAGEAEQLVINDEIRELRTQDAEHLPSVPGIHNDVEQRTSIHVLRRGVWENKGAAVGPRPLSILVPADVAELPADIENPRTHLARWLTSPQHPLTARVIVNRLWQHHFGTGLVATANDFGTRGAKPSHEELIDYLAGFLIDNGWRLKPLHRLMVLSRCYQQSSRNSSAEEALRLDPENRLLWRFNRRRLSAEEIRDAMLAVSGRLNRKTHGTSVIVPVDAELVNLLYKPEQWRVTEDVREHDRRTIYLIAKRNLRLPFLETFDGPTLQTSCARRQQSTHAPQALALMNGKLAGDLAAAFATRLDEEGQGNPQRMVDRAFHLALGREPTPRERQLSLAFLQQQPLEEFTLAMFNLNGFLYVR